jgi:hypothetical protein
MLRRMPAADEVEEAVVDEVAAFEEPVRARAGLSR